MNRVERIQELHKKYIDNPSEDNYSNLFSQLLTDGTEITMIHYNFFNFNTEQIHDIVMDSIFSSIETFNPSKKMKFNTFFSLVIKNKYLMEVDAMNAQKRKINLMCIQSSQLNEEDEANDIENNINYICEPEVYTNINVDTNVDEKRQAYRDLIYKVYEAGNNCKYNLRGNENQLKVLNAYMDTNCSVEQYDNTYQFLAELLNIKKKAVGNAFCNSLRKMRRNCKYFKKEYLALKAEYS
jgi:hypothetical protein